MTPRLPHHCGALFVVSLRYAGHSINGFFKFESLKREISHDLSGAKKDSRSSHITQTEPRVSIEQATIPYQQSC
jgi:hypothetical protein